MQNMKRILTILFIALSAICARADVQITARAPQQVVMGEQFRLQYVVNDQNLEDIELGSTSGFDVLAGPYTSSQSSFQIINGKTTQSSSVTVTYILMATSEGKHTIGSATAVVGGSQVKSKSLSIEVLPADKRSNGQTQSQSSSSQGGQTADRQQAKAGDGKDLFITVSASKRKVYEQEAILLTYKVYTLVNLVQLQGKMPELNGCHQQEIELPQQKSLKLEHYNGRNYRTTVWSQYVLFPQKSGKLSIPPIEFEGIVQQSVRSMDPFEAFFGGGSMIQEVKRVVKSPAIEIQVDALPQPKPANFSGAVGQFTISSSLTPQELKVNDALTLRLIVSGTGNMKLIQAPKVAFPTDFETYDAKIDDKTKVTSHGASGNKVFDYVAVPRHGGKFEIPAVEFCYFDIAKGQYQTLTTEAYEVQVEKGSGPMSQSYSATQKEDLSVLAEDIRYIKRGDSKPISPTSHFFASATYWLIYGGAILLFIILAVVFRSRIKANADIARQRGRKAGKQASKRLKKARGLMKNQSAGEFYEELLHALWGYVADRLNINVAELNRDNVAERLQAKGCPQETIDDFLSVLGDCEFARYAPGDPNENMDKMYQRAESIINQIK